MFALIFLAIVLFMVVITFFLCFFKFFTAALVRFFTFGKFTF
jgi:hypothetical protein